MDNYNAKTNNMTIISKHRRNKALSRFTMYVYVNKKQTVSKKNGKY